MLQMQHDNVLICRIFKWSKQLRTISAVSRAFVILLFWVRQIYEKDINKLTVYVIWRGEVVKENSSFWSDDDITFDDYGNVNLQDFR